MSKRVVITGLGIITPIGIGKDIFWEALINGKSGIKKVKSFDTSSYRSSLGGEVDDYNPEDFLSKEEIDPLDRSSQFIISTTIMALKDAQLKIDEFESERVSVIIGTTTATQSSFKNYHDAWVLKGYDSITLESVSKYGHESIHNIISNKYKLTGASVLMLNACAAGTYAIGQSYDLIKSGKADIVISGGTDAMSELAFCGFSNTRSLAKEACRPFDKNRDGLVVSEGAATLILESYENAISRCAHIYGEVIGYGLSCDANHMTAPDISGEGASLSINNALFDAQLNIDEIDYINAHGTGTSLNDLMETVAIKKVFGKKAYDIPISSIKSMIGHSFGASGAIEALTCALVLENGVIPPTINYNEPDPECDLNYVPNKSITKDVNVTLSNSYAFGGNNASIIIGKCKN